jgi:hypothetical protein
VPINCRKAPELTLFVRSIFPFQSQARDRCWSRLRPVRSIFGTWQLLWAATEYLRSRTSSRSPTALGRSSRSAPV